MAPTLARVDPSPLQPAKPVARGINTDAATATASSTAGGSVAVAADRVATETEAHSAIKISASAKKSRNSSGGGNGKSNKKLANVGATKVNTNISNGQSILNAKKEDTPFDETLPGPFLLEGELCYWDENWYANLFRHHEISGNWKWPKNAPPSYSLRPQSQSFKLTHTNLLDDELVVLPKEGEYTLKMKGGGYYSKVRVAEMEVKLTFKEKDDSSGEEFSVSGSGTNRYGAFELSGTAKKNEASYSSSPTFHVIIHKSYIADPRPSVAPASATPVTKTSLALEDLDPEQADNPQYVSQAGDELLLLSEDELAADSSPIEPADDFLQAGDELLLLSEDELAADSSPIEPADDFLNGELTKFDEAASSTESPKASKESEYKPTPEPTTAQLIRLVDSLFLEADKSTVTVNDIKRQIIAHFGWEEADERALIERKKIIKGRLTDLTENYVVPPRPSFVSPTPATNNSGEGNKDKKRKYQAPKVESVSTPWSMNSDKKTARVGAPPRGTRMAKGNANDSKVKEISNAEKVDTSAEEDLHNPTSFLLDGELSYSDHDNLRRHIICGNWKRLKNAPRSYSQSFALSRTIPPEEELTELPKDGEFEGSFNMQGMMNNIKEREVKLTFREKDDSNGEEFSVSGSGTNRYGAFELSGTATKNNEVLPKRPPTFRVSFQKRYVSDAHPEQAEVSQDMSQAGDELPASADVRAADSSSFNPANNFLSGELDESEEAALSTKSLKANKDSANEPMPEPTTSQIIQLVDSIFLEGNIHTITVEEINRKIIAHFGLEEADKKVLKNRKKIIKDRLTEALDNSFTTNSRLRPRVTPVTKKTDEGKKDKERKHQPTESPKVNEDFTYEEMSFEEQEALSQSINDLPEKLLPGAMQIIREFDCVNDDDDEIDLDINQLNAMTQRKLQRFVIENVKAKKQLKKRQAKKQRQEKAAASARAPAAPLSPPPVGKVEAMVDFQKNCVAPPRPSVVSATPGTNKSGEGKKDKKRKHQALKVKAVSLPQLENPLVANNDSLPSTSQRKQPPSYLAQPATSTVQPKDISRESLSVDMPEEEQKEREWFLMFTKALMEYLEQNDAQMHINAQAAMKDCYEKNKSGDPQFKSLTKSMKARLRATVGEHYWKKAHDYLNHFLKQKREYSLTKAGGPKDAELNPKKKDHSKGSDKQIESDELMMHCSVAESTSNKGEEEDLEPHVKERVSKEKITQVGGQSDSKCNKQAAHLKNVGDLNGGTKQSLPVPDSIGLVIRGRTSETGHRREEHSSCKLSSEVSVGEMSDHFIDHIRPRFFSLYDKVKAGLSRAKQLNDAEGIKFFDHLVEWLLLMAEDEDFDVKAFDPVPIKGHVAYFESTVERFNASKLEGRNRDMRMNKCELDRIIISCKENFPIPSLQM